jgi:O-antigen/teichoic acid export membrane protein/GT2 family glycosyltransferase
LSVETDDGRRRGRAAARLSVVIATFNRPATAERLLRQLAAQTLPPDEYEVVVVDDGSREPVSGWLGGLELPCRVKTARQPNAGAAAARHAGVLLAEGEILVVTDDDMQVPAGFLAAHLACHPPGSRRVVLGRIRPSSMVTEMPLFERFHADLLGRSPNGRPRGDALCTGNVSLRRADYLEVGGFDPSFQRGEDMDLGLRLEDARVEVVFSEDAFTIHDSDHADFARWRRQAVSYGRHGVRIGRKLPRQPRADPWRVFFGNAALKRPFVCAAVVSPRLGGWIGNAVHAAARGADRAGFERSALRLTSLLWDIEYFRGVREETGSLAATVRSCAAFLEKAEAADEPMPGVGRLSLRAGRLGRRLLRPRAARPGGRAAPNPVVARNAFHLFLGQLVTTALSIGLNALLARALGVADFGLLYLVTAMATFAYVVADWGQSSYLVREVAREPDRAGELLGTGLLLRVLGAFAVWPPTVLVAWLLGYDAHIQLLTGLMIAATLPLVLVQRFASVFRGKERMDYEAVVTVLAKALTLALTAAAFALGGRLVASIVAQGVGTAGALVLSVLFMRRLALPPLRVSRRTARELFVGGTPFAAMILTITAQSYLDALVLAKLAPALVVGWYGAARNVMNALITPASILGTATFPRLARSAARPADFQRQLRSSLRPLLGLGALAAVGTYLFADFAVKVIYGKAEFGPAALLLRVFAPVLLLFFVDVLLGNAVMVHRPGALAASKAIAILLTTGVDILLVPVCQSRFGNGAIGLLIGFAAGEMVMVAAAIFLLARGTLDREFFADLGRALAAAVGTVLLMSALPSVSPFLGIPLCVVVFGALSAVVGLVGADDLAILGALLGRPARAQT